MYTSLEKRVNINGGQYPTGPIHEYDNHIFAKIPAGGEEGIQTSPPLPLDQRMDQPLNLFAVIDSVL